MKRFEVEDFSKKGPCGDLSYTNTIPSKASSFLDNSQGLGKIFTWETNDSELAGVYPIKVRAEY